MPKERLDFKIISNLIEEDSRVLDLGCGEGGLLHYLVKEKKCHGSGIEISEKAIYECMAKGVTVSHGDIDTGLDDYSSKRFDYVILNGSLQEVLHPKKVILEALRVGKKVIVGMPNFCHLGARFQISLNGKSPITKELPYEWYDTPNLRFLSLRDFRKFCYDHQITILKEIAIKRNRRILFLPNLFATTGIYLLEGEK